MASICRDSRRPSSSKSIHSPTYSAHPYDPVPCAPSDRCPSPSNRSPSAPARTSTPPISRPIPTCVGVGRPRRNHGLRDVELWEVEDQECYPFWDPPSSAVFTSRSRRGSPCRTTDRAGFGAEDGRTPAASRREAPKPVRRALILTEKDEVDEKARLKELYNETAPTVSLMNKGRSPLLPTHTANTAPHPRSWKHPLSLLIIFFKCIYYIIIANSISGFTGTPISSRLMGRNGRAAFQRSEMAFAKTFERCEALPGISTGSYLERLEVLRSVLRGRSAAENGAGKTRQIYIAEPSASSEYYTAISKSKWFLSERPFLVVVDTQDGEGVLRVLTPKFEEDRARLLPFFDMHLHDETATATSVKSGPVRFIEDVTAGNKNTTIEFISWPEEQSPYSVLLDHIHSTSTSSPSSATQIHFDPANRSFIPWGIAQEIKDRGLGSWKIDVAGKEILSIRERKSEEEVRLLECANEFTLQAIRRTRRKTKFGMRESQVSAILEKEFEKVNMPGGEGLVLFGENAALPHGSGTDRVLTDKDLVLIDAGGSYKGYISDITRTFALEKTKISETQQRLWKLVADGQQAALDAAVKNGATGSDVDAAARNLIEAEGKREVERYGFSHRLGHGIGLEGHESPYLVGSNNQELLPGNTFSNEPGIYIVGEVGVRLEDCWVLEEGKNGEKRARMFTGPAKSLLEI